MWYAVYWCPKHCAGFGAHTGGGSKFGVGDVIGCGFDESSKDLFTRNGMRISGESHLRAFTKDICLGLSRETARRASSGEWHEDPNSDRVFVRVQKPVKRASRQLTHGEPVAAETQTARPAPQQCRILPELLQGASVGGGDVMYFEVAVLRAERDAPGRSFAEYLDVTVGVRPAA